MEVPKNEVVKSRKEEVVERLRSRKPELDWENEDVLFGAIYDDYDENDKFRTESEESNRRVVEVLEKDGKAGQFFVEMLQGRDPMLAMIEEYGPDFRAALEDPDKAEAVAEANRKHQEKILQNKELNEQAEANLQATLDALDRAQDATGVSDEVITKAYELYAQIVNDAIVNKVDEPTWKMLIKAVNYDEDVADAEHIGEVRGRNAKVDEFKRKTTAVTTMPPALTGQPAEFTPRRDAEELGALGRVGQPDMFARGGMKRKSQK